MDEKIDIREILMQDLANDSYQLTFFGLPPKSTGKTIQEFYKDKVCVYGVEFTPPLKGEKGIHYGSLENCIHYRPTSDSNLWGVQNPEGFYTSQLAPEGELSRIHTGNRLSLVSQTLLALETQEKKKNLIVELKDSFWSPEPVEKSDQSTDYEDVSYMLNTYAEVKGYELCILFSGPNSKLSLGAKP